MSMTTMMNGTTSSIKADAAFEPFGILIEKVRAKIIDRELGDDAEGEANVRIYTTGASREAREPLHELSFATLESLTPRQLKLRPGFYQAQVRVPNVNGTFAAIGFEVEADEPVQMPRLVDEAPAYQSPAPAPHAQPAAPVPASQPVGQDALVSLLVAIMDSNARTQAAAAESQRASSDRMLETVIAMTTAKQEQKPAGVAELAALHDLAERFVPQAQEVETSNPASFLPYIAEIVKGFAGAVRQPQAAQPVGSELALPNTTPPAPSPPPAMPEADANLIGDEDEADERTPEARQLDTLADAIEAMGSIEPRKPDQAAAAVISMLAATGQNPVELVSQPVSLAEFLHSLYSWLDREWLDEIEASVRKILVDAGQIEAPAPEASNDDADGED
ncbi:MAG: hypothetical protein AAFP26_08960 [Planctomycetota bacterium]